MPITDILARNANLYGPEISLVERDPAHQTRREITWDAFDRQANQVANALIKRGIRKNDKVVHLMMNCLEWLPIYFGILRTGAWVVPLNFRFNSEDIQYCTSLAEAKALIVKTGSRGAKVHHADGSVQEVPGFPVEVVNILGAGDAFAAGFIYGYLKGWDLYKSCRMGNACGAHVVTQLGCANFTPYEKDILEFIESKGGF